MQTWTSDDGSLRVMSRKPGADFDQSGSDARKIGIEVQANHGNWPTDLEPFSTTIIEDFSRGVSFAAVDAIGQQQLYCLGNQQQFYCGVDPATVLAAAGVPPTLDPQGLYDYLYFHAIPSPRTIYLGLHKVPNGCFARHERGRIAFERYWRPQFSEVTPQNRANLEQDLRDSLHDAVGAAARGATRPGAFLSGGLDSSTVAGLLAGIRPQADSFSIGFDAEGYDEMEYARIAVRRFKTTPHEKYVTPEDILTSVESVAAAFPEPFGNSSALAVYQCARLAVETGIDRLLAGDGGDELFGGNERYAKQMVFERYLRIPAVIRHALLEPTVDAAAELTRRFPIGKAKSYIDQANVPLPDRLQAYNYLHRHEPREVFSPGFLDAVRTEEPAELLRDEYHSALSRHAVDRMLFLDWKFTLHDNDLVKVNTMCRLAGVEVAYPMLDSRLVNLSLRMPAEWKVRRGTLRWLYKRALRDFLPREIIDKPKHGFGLPFGVWTATHPALRKLSEDALGSLATRGYFRTEFLRDALRMHQEVHAKFYGELVWVLMTLELWLQAHIPNARL